MPPYIISKEYLPTAPQNVAITPSNFNCLMNLNATPNPESVTNRKQTCPDIYASLASLYTLSCLHAVLVRWLYVAHAKLIQSECETLYVQYSL